MELYSWNFIKEKINCEIINKIMKQVDEEYRKNICYPEKKDIFNCFKYTNYKNLKVVIIGQDPYHGENEAHGLSFSVLDGVKMPPSLKNIFIELENDLNITRKKTNLIDWAEQGVLLLNSIMTVEKDKPLSHKNIGWESFTDRVIEIIAEESKNPIVFILWGNYARGKKSLIKNKKHLIIESPHPSFFSANRGFFGSKPFSKTNEFLNKNNIKEIDWSDEYEASI